MAKAATFTLSRPKALKLVKDLAADSSNVIFKDHASKRMRQQNVTPLEVINCLLKGVIVEGPAIGLKGDWELALERMGAGRRLRVAVAIDMPARLIMITVYDERG